MYRFLLLPRWLLAHVLVLALVVACYTAMVWQLRRLDERRERNAVMSQRQRAAPVDIESVFGLGDEASFRRVLAIGTYDTSNEVLLRSRALNGQPGYAVLTPLVMPSGRAVIVDRGWVPFAMDTPPLAQARPPDGTVDVRGVLLPSQRRVALGPKDPPGRLKTIGIVEVPRLARQLPYAIAGQWLLLTAQRPAQDELPRPEALPEPGDGPHRSYAVQWFTFGTIALFGYPIVIRSRANRRRKLTGA